MTKDEVKAMNVLSKAYHELVKKYVGAGLDCRVFVDMLSKRGVKATTVDLIMAPRRQTGFLDLWKLDKLDWTVEATVNRLWPQVSALFHDVDGLHERARKHLRDHGYSFE